MIRSRLPKASGLWLGLLTGLWLALHIDAKPAWLDEAFSLEMASTEWEVWSKLVSGREVNMALHSVLMRIWTGGGEVSEAWARVPSVLAVSLAVGWFVGWARRFLRSEAAVWLASLLFATNGFVLGHGVTARGYAFVLLLVVASTRLWLRAVDRAVEGRPGVWSAFTVYAVVAALLGPAHVLTASLLGAHLLHGLSQWLRARARSVEPKHIRNLAVAGIAALGIAGLANLLNALACLGGDGGNVSWVKTPGVVAFLATTHQVAGGQPIASPLVWIAGVIGCLTCLRPAMRPTSTHGSEHALVVAGFALCFFGPLAITFLVQPLWIDRYLTASAPFLALLAARGLTGPTLRRARLRFGAAPAVVLPALLLLTGPRSTPEPWREIARTVDEGATEGEAFLCFPRFLRTAIDRELAETARERLVPVWPPAEFLYYLDQTRQKLWWDEPKYLEQLRRFERGVFVLSTNRAWDPERFERLIEDIRSRGGEIESWDFERHFRVVRFRGARPQTPR